MFDNIVIVFFTVKNTESVYTTAFSIAKKFESKVDVLKCIYKEPPKFVVFETKSEKAKNAKKLEDAQNSLKVLEKIAGEDKISIKTQVDFTEELSEHVIKFVKAHKVDLLIMDTHQHHDGEENKDLVNRIYQEIECPLLTL